jgi:hypothetical protein
MTIDGMTLAQLSEKRDSLIEQGLRLADEVDAGKNDAIPALRASATEFKQVEEAINKYQEAGADTAAFRSAQAAAAQAAGNAGISVYGENGDGATGLFTPGEAFVRGRAYKEWLDLFPEGGPSSATSHRTAATPVEHMSSMLGLRNAHTAMAAQLAATPAGMRALINTGNAGLSPLIQPQKLGLLEPYENRPLTFLPLITTLPVTSDSLEWVRENVPSGQNADFVSEATALTGSSGLKPEGGGFDFEVVQASVQTIAEWVPATRKILRDLPQVRAYIDQFLVDDITLTIEEEVITGTGGTGFVGIMNTVGVNTVGPPSGSGASAITQLDLFRTARRYIQTLGRTFPNAVLVNPADAEAVERLKDQQGRYMGQGPFAAQQFTRVWGVPMVETEAMPAGTALMGDFRRAVLFDRERINISVGTVNDDFIRNIVRILAEAAMGFAVMRPKAFAVIDMAA